MCIVKYEEAIIPFLPELLTGAGILDRAPDSLWSTHPNLSLGWIHTLGREMMMSWHRSRC